MQDLADAPPTPILDRLTLWLAWLAGLALMFMVAIISTGVVLRYVFGTPLLGLNEINQMTAVVLVMAALPYCTLQNGHVGVDVFDNTIGPRGRFIGDVVSRLASGFVLSVLVWRAALKSLDAWEYEDATNMLDLPVWPFYAVLGLGAALCVLIFAVQLVDILKRGVSA